MFLLKLFALDLTDKFVERAHVRVASVGWVGNLWLQSHEFLLSEAHSKNGVHCSKNVHVDQCEEWRYRDVDRVEASQAELARYSDSHWVCEGAAEHGDHAWEHGFGEVFSETVPEKLGFFNFLGR